jgi:hypothetical protein
MEGTMTRIFALAIVVAACSGDEVDEKPAATRCETLREHLIDLRLEDAVQVDKNAHRDALRTAMGRDFLTACSKLSDDAITCALRAPDSSTASACAGTSTEN